MLTPGNPSVAARDGLPPRPGRAARVAQRRGLAETAHRPWPLPGGRWVIGQSWNHLLFAHWPLRHRGSAADRARAARARPVRGPGVRGRRSFRMETVRFAWCPPVVGTSSFAELNVRTYVTLERQAGRLLPQPGRGQPGRAGDRPARLRPALLQGRRLVGHRRRAGAVSGPAARPPRRLRGRVRPGGAAARPRARARSSTGSPSATASTPSAAGDLAHRGPPPALAPAARRGRPRRAAPALLARAGRGGLAG